MKITKECQNNLTRHDSANVCTAQQFCLNLRFLSLNFKFLEVRNICKLFYTANHNRTLFQVTRLQPDKAGNFEAGNPGENVILYIGIGMICLGLVITMVGLGDKGFRTLELKLVGPSFVGCGVFFTLLRILLCTMPSSCRTCFKCCSKSEEAETLIKKDPQKKKKKNVRQVNGDVIKNNRKEDAKDESTTDLHHAKTNGHVRRVSNAGQKIISEEHLVTVTDLSLQNINLRNSQLSQSMGKRQVHYRKPSDSYSTASSSSISFNHQELYHHQRDDDHQLYHQELNHQEGLSYHPEFEFDDQRVIPGSTRNIKSSGVILNATELRDKTKHIEGSTINLRSAEIFLNAAKLQIEI